MLYSVHVELASRIALIHCTIEVLRLTSQLKFISVYFRITRPVAAILEGKKIACFYTISEAQVARNLYFQYTS